MISSSDIIGADPHIYRAAMGCVSPEELDKKSPVRLKANANIGAPDDGA